jgi:ABC-type nitrate/sulfonate/bicarbonate transport system permease component
MKARYIAIPATGRFAPWLPLVGLIGFIVLWSLVSGLELVRSAFLPSPMETLKAMGKMVGDGTLLRESCWR